MLKPTGFWRGRLGLDGLRGLAPKRESKVTEGAAVNFLRLDTRWAFIKSFIVCAIFIDTTASGHYTCAIWIPGRKQAVSY